MRKDMLSLWDVVKRTLKRICNVVLVLCAILAIAIAYLMLAGAPTGKQVGNALFFLIGLPAFWLLVWFPFGELAELVRDRHEDRERMEEMNGLIFRLSTEVKELRGYIAFKTNVTPIDGNIDWHVFHEKS
ncbi:hypothetical protein [Nitratidesulfovibrio sp.]|uniref:hypothetical protein n=1 Tax=Nitratidesulfovibrio sp. TaxID=2802297 RepID=UPI003341BB75